MIHRTCLGLPVLALAAIGCGGASLRVYSAPGSTAVTDARAPGDGAGLDHDGATDERDAGPGDLAPGDLAADAGLPDLGSSVDAAVSGDAATAAVDAAAPDTSTDASAGDSSGHAADADLGRDAASLDRAEAPCLDVACSGRGFCVAVDGEPTCACERGAYAVGLTCLEDPCAQGGSCYYLDAAGGSDAAAGTSPAEAWQTLSPLVAAMASLQPGDYVLLRRGGEWTSSGLIIRGVVGSEAQPVTFGAYGPREQPRPRLVKINLQSSSHVTIRDVEVAGSEGGPCISVAKSDNMIVQDTVVHDCPSNGILFGEDTSYGVMVDNFAYDIHANDALVIHSPMVITEASRVKDHHWIVDNRVHGPVREQAVDVATGNDDFPGVQDVKVVGNQLGGGTAGCIMIGHGSSVTWVVGNILGNCPTARTAAPLSIGGQHGANSGSRFEVRGNVVFWNLMAERVISEEPQAIEAVIEQNTFVTAIGERAVFSLQYQEGTPSGALHFNRNILWTTGSQWHLALTAGFEEALVTMDHNWYVPDTGGCTLGGQSLAQWQESTGLDGSSACAAVPGLTLPSEAEVGDFESWGSAAFLSHFVPEPTWSGCAEGVGALTCSGEQRVQIVPIAGYDDNGGYGWRGPLIVRQRYPLP